MATALHPRTVDVVMDRLFPEPDPYLEDPAGWIRDKLGEHLWSKQVEVAEMVRDNRYTAVPSCHDSGKSFLAARLVAWWLDVHPLGSAFAVTTAPTDPQVKAILWREIGQAHRKADLDGRLTLDAQWYMGPEGKELVAYGRKPADYVDSEKAAAAFQGIHARYVLIILDEACGIPKWLWNAVDSLATNRNARVLAIGNPDDPATQFEKVCRPGSGWKVVPISAFDTPNFTDEWVPEGLEEDLLSPEWVEERKKRWGEKAPLYISKVLGLFPEVSDDTLISPSLVRLARERSLAGLGHGRFGVDVARFGSDETVIYRNRDGVIRLWAAYSKRDTMETAGHVIEAIEATKDESPAIIDVVGLGAGVYDRLHEQNFPVYPFEAGAKANNPKRFVNRRAEAWWELRTLMEDELIDLDPEDEDLAAQLTTVKYKPNSSGRIVLESKDKMRERGLPSPDRGDAVVMSAVEPPHVPARPKRPRGRKPATVTGDLMERAM